jgi:hypothetical protein
MSDEQTSKPKDPDNITLSAALLAPINSIFEAQVHSARAFLNFILQMGFRHRDSRDDYDSEDDYKSYLKSIQDQQKPIRDLLKKREKDGFLSEADIAELKRLNAEFGDLHQQSIDFIDNTGNAFQVSIPNLALLPIKPLAISEADFTYKFEVRSETTDFDQNGASGKLKKKDKDNPWFLIKPKSLQGGFAKQTEESKEKTIKINVKVGNTEIPYGLEKLLVHLTNNAEPIDTREGTSGAGEEPSQTNEE